MSIDTIDLTDPDQIASEIRKVPAHDFVKDSYGLYAMYTIRNRALISDDGLKPVNRRVLYSMFRNGIGPSHQHQKAAKVAGYCTTWHPHGTSSIEGALARMGQDFSMRIPLIDAYGSVGFVTGDEPGAARYWEARLTPAAMEMLNELKEGATEMTKNYDGTEDEPTYLPVRFPNNIINGSEGIAVGYASKMAPHNPTEVMNAVLLALKKPKFTVDDILEVMPGPDFPTGGELLSVDGIRDYYETGEGKFTVRGRYEVDNLPRGKSKITFYELPFQVSAEAVITSIKKSQQSGKLKEIARVTDLTDMANGLSLQVETKAGTNYKSVINELFKVTPIESNFSVSNTVLVHNSPKVVSMVELITDFIAFREDCLLRKSSNRLEKIESRMHQLQGLLAALVDIDKCIAIIRNADSPEQANEKLCKQFKIDQEQANYILSMQLRRLTKADSIALNKENNDLNNEKEHIEAMLQSKDLIKKELIKEVKETAKIIADERRTVISGKTAEDIKEEQAHLLAAAKNADKNVDCWITRFADGTLLKTLETYNTQISRKKVQNGPIIEQLKMQTKDMIVIIGDDGIGHRVPLTYLMENIPTAPKDVGVDFAKNVQLIGLSKNTAEPHETGTLMMTNHGTVKIAKTDYPVKDEFPVFNIDSAQGERIIASRWVDVKDGVVVSISSDSNLLCFKTQEIRASGANAGGVRGQKLAAGQEIVGFNWVPKEAFSPGSVNNAYKVVTKTPKTIKQSMLTEYSIKGRGTQGMRSHPLKKDEKGLVSAYVGENPAAVIGTGSSKNKLISLPGVSKRTTVGTELELDITLGENITE